MLLTQHAADGQAAVHQKQRRSRWRCPCHCCRCRGNGQCSTSGRVGRIDRDRPKGHSDVGQPNRSQTAVAEPSPLTELSLPLVVVEAFHHGKRDRRGRRAPERHCWSLDRRQCLSVYDPNNPGTLTVTLSASDGTLSTTTSGSDSVSGDGSTTLSVSGSLTNVNASLADLVYSADSAGSGALAITAHDSNGTGTASVNVAVFDEPPAVAGVYVSSTQWNSSFLSYLDSRQSGSLTGLGYAVPAGSAQLDTISWGNVDTISVAFTKNVDVSEGSLTLIGSADGLTPPDISGFSYNSSTFVATWTFSDRLAGRQVLDQSRQFDHRSVGHVAGR